MRVKLHYLPHIKATYTQLHYKETVLLLKGFTAGFTAHKNTVVFMRQELLYIPSFFILCVRF